MDWSAYFISLGPATSLSLAELVTEQYGEPAEDGSNDKQSWPSELEEIEITLPDYIELHQYGEVALSMQGESEDQENIMQYVRWGSGALGRAPDAVQAGVWPLSSCSLSGDLEDGESIELVDGLEGQGTADYVRVAPVEVGTD
jgi:hypothetical protein